MARDFRKIKAWQRADTLAQAIYTATRDFPKEERYGLTSQMRRSAVSIAANIAEGSARSGQNDYLRFLNVALGSFRELEYYCYLAEALGYLPKSNHLHLEEKLGEVGRTLHGLTRSVQSDD